VRKGTASADLAAIDAGDLNRGGGFGWPVRPSYWRNRSGQDARVWGRAWSVPPTEFTYVSHVAADW